MSHHTQHVKPHIALGLAAAAAAALFAWWLFRPRLELPGGVVIDLPDLEAFAPWEPQ